MTEPKLIATLKLVALMSAALLLWNGIPAPRWAAGLETASFRLSLSMNADTVRFRTGAFETGQSRLSFMFESGR